MEGVLRFFLFLCQVRDYMFRKIEEEHAELRCRSASDLALSLKTYRWRAIAKENPLNSQRVDSDREQEDEDTDSDEEHDDDVTESDEEQDEDDRGEEIVA